MTSRDQDARRRARADPEDESARERARLADARNGQEPSAEALMAAVRALHPDRVFLRTEAARERCRDGDLKLSWTYTSLRGRRPGRAGYDQQDRRELLAVRLAWSARRPALQSRTERAEVDPYGRV